MTNNVGMLDRIARIIVGAALIAFALGYLAPGVANHVDKFADLDRLVSFGASTPPSSAT